MSTVDVQGQISIRGNYVTMVTAFLMYMKAGRERKDERETYTDTLVFHSSPGSITTKMFVSQFLFYSLLGLQLSVHSVQILESYFTLHMPEVTCHARHLGQLTFLRGIDHFPPPVCLADCLQGNRETQVMTGHNTA